MTMNNNITAINSHRFKIIACITYDKASLSTINIYNTECSRVDRIEWAMFDIMRWAMLGNDYE